MTTDEIANGQVKAGDIGGGEVKSGNVANDNLTGGDVAANSLKGADIDESTLSSIGGGGPAGGDLTGSYPNPLIGPNAVGTSEVINGSLNDEDVGQGTFVNFEANIGVVAAHDCGLRPITGVNAQGDHLLLTPADDSLAQLIYSVSYSTANPDVALFVCNPTASDIDDETTHFNLLVIDAQ